MQKKTDLLSKVLFPIIIIFFTFYKVNIGIDLGDHTYNLENFKWMSNLENMWLSATLLSNVVGHIFTLLPGGQFLLGMNIYTSLVKLALAIICYFFCTKELKISSIIVLVGEISALGLCWNPCTVLYNYLTYLLFLICGILLYYGLKTNKNIYYILAGFVLAINVFVRFSNLPEVAIILALWGGLCIRKEKISEYFSKSLLCILSYAATLTVGVIIISLTIGINTYISGVLQLFSMDAGDGQYTPLGMIINIIKYYFAPMGNFAIILFAIAFLIIIEHSKLNTLIKSKLAKIFLGLFIGIIILFIYFRRGLFTFEYQSYSSVMDYGFMFLLIFMITFFCVTINAKNETGIRNASLISLVILLITPIGSNNALFCSVNNLFLVLPIFIHVLISSEYLKRYMPVKSLILVLAGFLLVQSTLFGHYFIYGDSNAREGAYINGNSVLKGMKSGRATSLETLTEYIDKYSLNESTAIVYNLNYGLPYVLDTPFDIKSAGYVLLSYKAEQMDNELTLLSHRIDSGEQKAPYILISPGMRELIDYCFKEKLYTNSKDILNSELGNYDKKNALLIAFMQKYGYHLVESTDLCDLYIISY